MVECRVTTQRVYHTLTISCNQLCLCPCTLPDQHGEARVGRLDGRVVGQEELPEGVTLFDHQRGDATFPFATSRIDRVDIRTVPLGWLDRSGRCAPCSFLWMLA